jgi:hypothetical protein
VTRTGRSLVGFGVYVAGTGAGLVISPNAVLWFLLTTPTYEHWIRLLGTSAIVLGCYYIVAGLHNLTVMARASLWARGIMIALFTTFVIAKIAPVLLLGMAGNEAAGIAWTWWALRRDAQDA